ncbi:orphan protein [Pandoravirus kuranda]|uniref:Orphan protein n=1 Tax=Pandoravirus kuranda TaxID=3019033 RepID=A0AA95EDH7_9VIRU|nr:orphan protein [Pandoravirus kuranda]
MHRANCSPPPADTIYQTNSVDGPGNSTRRVQAHASNNGAGFVTPPLGASAQVAAAFEAINRTGGLIGVQRPPPSRRYPRDPEWDSDGDSE